jgi:hypothetical protein
MKSKFLTPLLLGSALTMGALGFVACGDDGSDFPSQPGGTSSSSGFIAPSSVVQTETTAIVFSDLGISSTGLSKVKFKGSITLDLSDSSTVADVNAVRITNITFEIVSKSMTSNGVAATMTPLDFNGQVTTVNLAESGLYTNLDENYSECGDFLLLITVYATDGQIPSVTQDTIQFERPIAKCQAPESSSSEVQVPGAPLDSVTITVNTKTDKCLSFATASASAATTGDVCFSTTGTQGNVRLTSTTGLKFAVYANAENDTRLDDWSKNWLPENPTTDSFMYLTSALKDEYPNFLEVADVFFVAINPDVYKPNTGTAAGFYAFIVTEASAPDTNGDLTMKLLVYKGK